MQFKFFNLKFLLSGFLTFLVFRLTLQVISFEMLFALFPEWSSESDSRRILLTVSFLLLALWVVFVYSVINALVSLIIKKQV